jgi:Predicted nucleic acid-binding protein, contains PIN domain
MWLCIPWADHILCAIPVKKSWKKIKAQKIRVVTDTEVLQEILYRYFSIKKYTFGEIAYISMVQFCAKIFPVRVQDTDRALELLKTSPAITSRDAIHAATMINNGIKQILSTDTHFDLIPEIRRIDPAKV